MLHKGTDLDVWVSCWAAFMCCPLVAVLGNAAVNLCWQDPAETAVNMFKPTPFAENPIYVLCG